MAAKPDRPPPAPKPRSHDRPRAPDEGSDGCERYGPLRIARHAKDDGRSLVLYVARGELPEGGG
jgi:hypothetical protein